MGNKDINRSSELLDLNNYTLDVQFACYFYPVLIGLDGLAYPWC